MKKHTIIRSMLLLLLAVSFFDCSSDELTKSKVEKMIKNCSKDNPYQKITVIRLDEQKYSKVLERRFEKYQPLVDAGVLKIKQYEEMRKNVWTDRKKMTKFIKIEPTSKGEKHLVSGKDHANGIFTVYDYALSEVTKIHTVPSFNIAEVYVKFEAKNKTPFAELEKNDNMTKERKFVFEKTDNGWEFCEGKKEWWGF